MFSSFERQWSVGRAAVRFAAVAGLLILAPFAEAQTPPSAAKAAAAVAEPSPSHLAAARELVIVSGMSRSFNAAIPAMMSRLSSSLTQTRPELASDLSVVLKQIRPEFDKDTDEMVDKAAHIYARFLTEQEIKATIAFFTSEPGKKYVQTQPYFFDDVVNAMQDWHQKIEAQLVTRVRAEMKKKGHNL